MSQTKWSKLNFQDFVDKYNKAWIIENAPPILYSKKDKEPEAFCSLIAFFFIIGGLFIYISLSFLFVSIYFSLSLFLLISIVFSISAIVLILNYFRSHVLIYPLEGWVEVFENSGDENSKYLCLIYYPVFSGKSHPNKAKNVLYKVLQEELFKSKIDITQIEVYLKISPENSLNYEQIGYFFQYGEGLPFKNEGINRNSWKFFPSKKASNENYLAIANWDHQFEWRDDLELDYDKLHNYAPWIIQKWNEENLKPLTEFFKDEVNWDLRPIDSFPKLSPWIPSFQSKEYESFSAYKDLQLMNDAIERVIGKDFKIEKLKDIKNYILEFKAYLRDSPK
jgi:hypothetical protein